MQITAVQSGLGMIFFCLLLLAFPGATEPVSLGFSLPPWAAWVSVLYLGGFVTFGATALSITASAALSAGQAALIPILVPVSPGLRRAVAPRAFSAHAVCGVSPGDCGSSAQPVAKARPCRGLASRNGHEREKPLEIRPRRGLERSLCRRMLTVKDAAASKLRAKLPSVPVRRNKPEARFGRGRLAMTAAKKRGRHKKRRPVSTEKTHPETVFLQRAALCLTL